MCDHHHTARHILCPQCDLLMALPQLEHRQKAACPRCSTTLTTTWDASRQRPTTYVLVVLFILLLANLFPLIYMKVGGISSEIALLEAPNALFTEDYASLGTLSLLSVQPVPVFCLVTISLLVNRARMSTGSEAFLVCVLFHFKTWGMTEISPAGVLVNFVELMAYDDIGIGLSFILWCMFCLLQLCIFQCVDRCWLQDDITPMPATIQPPRVGVTGICQRLCSCACCTAALPANQTVCLHCHSKGTARCKNSLQWTLVLLVTLFVFYLPASIIPIMITDLLGGKMPLIIMAGMVLLRSEGSYPVVLVTFIASIMVPTLKMTAIARLCWNANGNGVRDSERMCLIYEVVEFAGCWSMIDVFVIAVLSALVRMGGLMNIYLAIGVVMFALVVVMTMSLAMMSNPRSLWDRGPDSSHEEMQQHGK